MNLFRKHNHKPFEKQLEEQLGDMEYKPSESLWDRIDSGITSDGFEKPVRSKLERFEQMPYPETWKRIESRLPAEKQPFRRYVLFGAAFIALIGAVTTAYLFNQQTETPQLAVSTVEAPAQEDQIEIIPAPSQTAPNKIKADLVEDKEQVVSSQSVSTPAPKSVAPETQSAQTTQAKQSASATQPLPAVQRNTQSNASAPKPIAKVSPQPSASVVLAPSVASSNSSSEVSPSSSQPTTAAAVAAPMLTATQKPTPAASASIPPASSSIPESHQSALVSDTPKQTMAAAPIDSSMNIQGREITNGIIAKPDTNVAAVHFNNEPNEDELTRFSISVFAGMSLSGTTYSSPENSSINFDENIKLRKEIERAQVDWSGSFMLDYRINDRWMVSAGLTMVNFNQNVHYDIDSAVNPSQPNDIGAPVTNPGDSFLVGNTYSNRIRYTWTEIPLMVNYTALRGNRWDIDIQGGVGYAFISTIDGGMVSYDNKGVLVLKDKESFPHISNTVFATLQPQISKKFAQGVSVGIVPSFKYSLTSIIGNENWVQQHPYFIGLSACIRKRF